jgi:hypothetical protein
MKDNSATIDNEFFIELYKLCDRHGVPMIEEYDNQFQLIFYTGLERVRDGNGRLSDNFIVKVK